MRWFKKRWRNILKFVLYLLGWLSLVFVGFLITVGLVIHLEPTSDYDGAGALPIFIYMILVIGYPLVVGQYELKKKKR